MTNVNESNCSTVDDIKIGSGIDMKNLYKISLAKEYKNSEQYYTMQWIFEGSKLTNLIHLKILFDESKMALSDNDKYSVGIYAKSNEINYQIILDYHFDIKKYSDNFSELNIFINSYFYCFYYNNDDKYIGSYLRHSFENTSLPIQKEDFNYFRVDIIAKILFFLTINELIINSRLKNNLTLCKLRREMIE